MAPQTLLLSGKDVLSLLTIAGCIAAVEAAFDEHARGRAVPPGVLGTHLEGGGFHIKTAGLSGLFVTKVNGNFDGNEARGLPRIQGLIILSEATTGTPLAVMDSAEITAVRTAAATAVAAKFLAREGRASVALIGCGRQALWQLRALAAVRELTCVLVVDLDPLKARAFAREASRELRLPVEPALDVRTAARQCGIVVTCTNSRRVILCEGDVAPGTFIAAVGADSDSKQEISTGLLARAAVVPDILEQAATIGDLHHAIAAGVMRREDVRAELGAVVAGKAKGRISDDEIVVFDSTGTALQDVAAAALVYERATRLLLGATFAFTGGHTGSRAGGYRL